MTRIICTVTLIFVTAFCAACNSRPQLKRPDGMPELHPCSVAVTFGGQIIEGVLVSLIPEDASEWAASGSTDKTGTAAPCASYGFKGVPAGTYTVTFTCVVQNPDYNESDPKSMPLRSMIPPKYGKGQFKEIVEIKAGEKNKFTYELEAGEAFIRL